MFRSRPIQYILDERGEPLPADDNDSWGDWLLKDERRIVRRQDFVLGDPDLVTHPVKVTVSTVFMGMDAHFEGPPVLWETLVSFEPEPDDDIEIRKRYTSRADAIAGHNAIVAELGGPVLEN